MEEVGRLRTRYHVMKSGGLFSKHTRILDVCENGFMFTNPIKHKDKKDIERFFFKDLRDVSPHGEKDLSIKVGKQNFTLTYGDRLTLFTDLMHYQDQWSIKNKTDFLSKIPFFIGTYQSDSFDPSSKLKIIMRIMRTGVQISYTVKEEEKSQNCFSLNFNEIESINVKNSDIIIFHQMNIYQFTFQEETVPVIIDILKELPKKNLGIQLNFQSNAVLIEKKLPVETEFNLVVLQRGIKEKPIKLHIDKNILIEEDVNTHSIIFMHDLSTISSIKILRRKNSSILQIHFLYKIKRQFIVTEAELQAIVANIIYSLQSKDDSENFPLIFLGPISYHQRIQGMPLEVDLAFDTMIKNTIEDAKNKDDILQEQLLCAFLDAILNTKFKSIGYDQKFFSSLMNTMIDLGKIIITLEAEKKAYESYLEYQDQLSGKSEIKVDSSAIISESGKILHSAYVRLPPLFSLIRVLLSWRTNIADSSNVLKQIEMLLKLSCSKDSIISLCASQTLQSFLKTNKMAERKLEMPSKKWIIRELEVIPKITNAIELFLDEVPETLLSKIESGSTLYDLQLFGLLNILTIVFQERKELMNLEDYTYISVSILDNDNSLYIMERIFMHKSHFLVSQITYILFQAFSFVHLYEKPQVLALRQQKVITLTSILFWNLRVMLRPLSTLQHKMTIHLVSLLVVTSSDCCTLISKIFPKFLFRKVSSEKNLVEWKLENWKNFFFRLDTDYNTATEQWNGRCKQELDKILFSVGLDFFMKKHSPNSDQHQFVRWNVEEFEMSYNFLVERYKIGKYYLKDLVKYSEDQKPYLTEKVTKPVVFFQKLIHSFVNTNSNIEQMKLILQGLILVYQEHSQNIKDIKLLPHFVNILDMDELKALHRPVLELIHTSLNVKSNEVFSKNYKKIIKSRGLWNLINILCRCYVTHDHPRKTTKIRKAAIILRIFTVMLAMVDKKFVYPKSRVRIFLEHKTSISAIIQLLLINDIGLRKQVMLFLREHFMGIHELLLEQGLSDFLIICINEQTGYEALGLLIKLQALNNKYNKTLDLSPFSFANKCLISRYDKLRNSIFLRYFPVPFVKYICEETEIERILTVFALEKCERFSLLWNRSMRELLQNELNSHLRNILENLTKFASEKRKGFRKVDNMPIYTNKYQNIIKYPQIEQEICCGEIYLRIWNQMKDYEIVKDEETFYADLKNTFLEISSDLSKINLGDLVIVLNSYIWAYNLFTTKTIFPCYSILLQIMENTCNSINEPIMKVYLKNMCKFTYRTMKIGLNFSAFEEIQGCHKLIPILIQYLATIDKQTITIIDLSGLKWEIAVLFESFERNTMVYSSIELSIRHKLLNKLFRMVYSLQNLLFNGELSLREKTPHRVKFILNSFLKLQKYTRPVENMDAFDLPVASVLQKGCDSHTLSLILHVIEITYNLVNQISQTLDSQKEIVENGWGIFGLWAFFANSTINYTLLKSLFDIDYYKALAMMTIRHLLGFSVLIRSDLTEPLLKYSEILKNIFGEHLISFLISGLEVVAHRIKQAGTKVVTDRLSLAIDMMNKNIEHPHCIWNESTRSELKEAAFKQLEKLYESNEGFSDILETLVYTPHKEEIIVGGAGHSLTFIRVLNKDPYGRLTNPALIMQSIIAELAKIEVKELDMDESRLTYTLTLLEALNNIITFQQGIDLSVLAPDYLSSLCKFLQPGIDSIPKRKENIYNYILSILIELTKDPKQSSNMMSTKEFVRFALFSLIKLNNEFIVRRVLACIEGLIGSRDSDEAMFYKGFLVTFLCHSVKNTTLPKYRTAFLNLVQIILSRRKGDKKFNVLLNLLPGSILDKISDTALKSEEILSILDSNYKDIYLIWDTTLRTKVISTLELEMQELEKGWEQGIQEWKIPEKSCYAHLVNVGEICISNVVISVYNTQPFVKFRNPYGTFLTELVLKIEENLRIFSMYRIDAEKLKGEEEKEARKNSVEQIQEMADLYQQGIVCMLCTLLLSYEQIYRNLFNHNKITDAMLKKSIESMKDNFCLAFSGDKIKDIIILGLQVSNSSELIIILLQILLLLCEQGEVLTRDHLQTLSTAIVQSFISMLSPNGQIDEIKEFIYLWVMLKLIDRVQMTKAKDPILDPLINMSLLDKLRLKHTFKEHLRSPVERMLNKIMTYPYYYKVLSTEIKFEISPAIKLEKIHKAKFEPMDRIWRKSPTTVEETKIYASPTFLEEISVKDLNLGILPVLSRSALNNEKFFGIQQHFIEKYQSVLEQPIKK